MKNHEVGRNGENWWIDARQRGPLTLTSKTLYIKVVLRTFALRRDSLPDLLEHTRRDEA